MAKYVNLPAQALQSGGFEKAFEIDFRTFTPTSIAANGITTVDGVDFDMSGHLGGTSIDVGGPNGARAVGGSQSIGINIDLDTVEPGFDVSDETMIAIVIESDDLDDGWAVFLGQLGLGAQRVGFFRTSTTIIAIQRIIGTGVFSNDSRPIGTTKGQSFLWTSGGGVVSRYTTGAVDSDTSPQQLELGGASAGGDGGGLDLFTAPGGELRLAFTNAASRNNRILGVTGWFLPIPA